MEKPGKIMDGLLLIMAASGLILGIVIIWLFIIELVTA